MTVNKTIPVNPDTIKAKRGRKSKKDLIASLQLSSFSNDIISTVEKPISLSVNDIEEPIKMVLSTEDTIYNEVLNEIEDDITSQIKTDDVKEQKQPIKKRGRKPKGGKIIQQMSSDQQQLVERPNVILHLKCSMKDLIHTNQSNYFHDAYNNSNDMSFDIIGGENVKSVSTYYDNTSTSITGLDNKDEDGEDLYCKDTSKEVWKKLKQLEHNLHINNVNNKKSACFWDTCEFDNPPIYIPKHFINGTYHVYGCFCSPECGVAYLMNENIDSSAKFERYHLFNHIYTKIYDYSRNIRPAPSPYYMLEKYYGNLSIQEYRALLRNERLFLIIDKPLTRILPELHEDNDDFILNNKIIPSNYQVKTRLQRKKQNKNSILNEKFGVTSSQNNE
jgi:hypothetical protein